MIFARKMKIKDLNKTRRMTNEEAIRNIVAYKRVYADYIPEDVWEAFDIAIKALKERPTGKWQPLSFKTLNGDDIVAYESSCCGAIADKKYQRCPKCDAKMDEGEK